MPGESSRTGMEAVMTRSSMLDAIASFRVGRTGTQPRGEPTRSRRARTSNPGVRLAALMLFVTLPPVSAAQQTSILYVAPLPNQAANNAIWLANPDGTNNAPIPVQLVGPQFPKWSRDATLIAAEGAPVNQGTPGIFVFDRAGQNLRQVFDLLGGVFAGAIPQVAFSAFSPDGQRLAISYQYTTTPAPGSLSSKCWAVLVYSIAGTLISTVGGECVQSSLSTGFSGWGIDWSPTKDLLVGGLLTVKYCVDALGNRYPVTVTDLNSAPPTANATATTITNENPCAGVSNPLLLSAIYDLFPVFSRNGTKIAYVQWTQLILGGPITR